MLTKRRGPRGPYKTDADRLTFDRPAYDREYYASNRGKIREQHRLRYLRIRAEKGGTHAIEKKDSKPGGTDIRPPGV